MLCESYRELRLTTRCISSSNTKNLKNVVREPDTLLHSTIQISILMNFSLDPEEWHLHTRVHSSCNLKSQKPRRKPTWLSFSFRFPSAIEPKIDKVESQKRFIPLQHPIKLGLSCISVFVQVVISWFGRAGWNEETEGEEEQHYFTHACSLRPENGLYTARSGTVPSASPICRLLWHSSSSLTPSFHSLFLRPCPLPYSTFASSPRFTSAPASSSPPPTSSSFATLPFLFFCRRLAMRGACIPGHTLPPDGLLPFLLVRETSRQLGHYLRFPFRMYSGILRVSRRDWRQFYFGFVVNADGRGTLVRSFKVSRVF